MKLIFILCMMCFALLTIHNFVKWIKDEKDFNDFLGRLNAFIWCLIASRYIS